MPALLLGLAPLVLFNARAYGSDGPALEHILNLDAYAKDGARVGTVADVRRGEDGEIFDVHIRVGSHLGIGEKTVSVPAELTISLRGALIVELTADEVARLRAVDGPR